MGGVFIKASFPNVVIGNLYRFVVLKYEEIPDKNFGYELCGCVKLKTCSSLKALRNPTPSAGFSKDKKLP